MAHFNLPQDAVLLHTDGVSDGDTVTYGGVDFYIGIKGEYIYFHQHNTEFEVAKRIDYQNRLLPIPYDELFDPNIYIRASMLEHHKNYEMGLSTGTSEIALYTPEQWVHYFLDTPELIVVF